MREIMVATKISLMIYLFFDRNLSYKWQIRNKYSLQALNSNFYLQKNRLLKWTVRQEL